MTPERLREIGVSNERERWSTQERQAVVRELIAALDAERERNAKLERVLDAAWDIAKGRCTTFGYHFKGGDGEALDRAISEARRP